MPSKNPEVLARAQKNWRKKNPDYLRNWRAANPDKTEKYNEGVYELRKDEAKSYYQKNRERICARQREYRRANPEKNAERQLKRYFGITMEQKRTRWIEQDKKCAICQKPQTLLSIHVDHIHGTDPIILRGLLCGSCNRAIGLLQDNPIIIAAAASYLLNY